MFLLLATHFTLNLRRHVHFIKQDEVLPAFATRMQGFVLIYCLRQTGRYKCCKRQGFAGSRLVITKVLETLSSSFTSRMAKHVQRLPRSTRLECCPHPLEDDCSPLSRALLLTRLQSLHLVAALLALWRHVALHEE